MNKKISIAISDAFTPLINGKISFENLKNVIQKGIDSGIVHDFDPEKHL
ncbi:hypothetical protein [Neptunitalea lumnitzerae]|uniref:Uncharacterized protein n=1 Tax=Neptunitalea lumnitzerae TaxID=2965509 RepID=A0ABQ5MJ16_9FLAO|nr:hypothetical protein [Neptunitalea sp. Y10]GLB49411.1 hypothetical protein Y10_17790 [Neptunitalea sp. Y10]